MARMRGTYAHWNRGILTAVAVLAASVPAWGQQSAEDVELSPAAAAYLVLRDANIRALPETKSKRVGSVKSGTRIESAGKAKGTDWVSVKEDGRVIGFVYAPVLAATIDGTLQRDLIGVNTATAGPQCRHRVHFDGKSQVEGEPLETADYRIAFQCSGERDLAFDAVMFITEIPYRSQSKDTYQISIDIPEIADTVERVLSVTVMYHADDEEVVFDAISDPDMASGAPVKKRPAHSVPEALSNAVAIAVSAWGAEVWKQLAARPKPILPAPETDSQ